MYRDSYIVPLEIYPAEIKVQVGKDRNVSSVRHCLQQQRNLKQPKSSPVEEWLNKPWFVYTTEYDAAITKTKVDFYAFLGSAVIDTASEKSKLQNSIT